MSSTSCCCCCLYSPWRKFKSCTACFMYIIFITVCMFCNLCHMNDLVSLYAGLQPADWESSSGAAGLNQYGYIWHLLTTCVSFSHIAMSQISAASGYYRWITSESCAKINICVVPGGHSVISFDHRHTNFTFSPIMHHVLLLCEEQISSSGWSALKTYSHAALTVSVLLQNQSSFTVTRNRK